MSRGIIVLLRAQEDSDALAEAVRNQGYEPLFEPILGIEYLETNWNNHDPTAPLVFTSAHAVRAFSKATAGREPRVYTVGTNTAEAAQVAGFTDIRNAAGTSEELVALLQNEDKQALSGLIYVRGEDISRDLKGNLEEKGIDLHEIVAYKANPAQNLSIKLLHALDRRQIKAVVVFSARGGQTFAELIEQYGRTVRLKSVIALCISEYVVQSVSVLPFGGVRIAAKPDRYGMIDLMKNVSITKEQL